MQSVSNLNTPRINEEGAGSIYRIPEDVNEDISRSKLDASHQINVSSTLKVL
jgi:hypothetical protein